MGWQQRDQNGGLNPDVPGAPGDCLNRDSIHDFPIPDYSIHGDLIRYGLIHPVRCEAFAAVCGLFSCSY